MIAQKLVSLLELFASTRVVKPVYNLFPSCISGTTSVFRVKNSSGEIMLSEYVVDIEDGMEAQDVCDIFAFQINDDNESRFSATNAGKYLILEQTSSSKLMLECEFCKIEKVSSSGAEISVTIFMPNMEIFNSIGIDDMKIEVHVNRSQNTTMPEDTRSDGVNSDSVTRYDYDANIWFHGSKSGEFAEGFCKWISRSQAVDFCESNDISVMLNSGVIDSNIKFGAEHVRTCLVEVNGEYASIDSYESIAALGVEIAPEEGSEVEFLQTIEMEFN